MRKSKPFPSVNKNSVILLHQNREPFSSISATGFDGAEKKCTNRRPQRLQRLASLHQ